MLQLKARRASRALLALLVAAAVSVDGGTCRRPYINSTLQNDTVAGSRCISLERVCIDQGVFVLYGEK